MAVRASQIFDFIEQHQQCAVERHEVSLYAFSILRRSLRFIVMSLRDADDPESREISDRLRALLSEWLTVPVPFDNTILDSFQAIFSTTNAMGERWGEGIKTAYNEACKAAKDLSFNPLRKDLQTVIVQLKQQCRTFRIYCHKRARPHFESLFAEQFDHGTFLHSIGDYRQAEPADTLIKVGPLRSRGWGSAPDALLTAPRFATLVQIVWSGCGDEPDFGYDPVSEMFGSESTKEDGLARNDHRNGITWSRRVTSVGDDLATFPDHSPDSDEFQIFGQLKQVQDNRLASLIQIDEAHGILYPPHSNILSFDPSPSADKPIGRRLLGEGLFEGMFIVRALLADVDFGGLQAEHGHFSQIWKARLTEEREKACATLTRRLREAGLNLLHLGIAIGHWCEPPSTVIRAPQQRTHFEILIRVLGIGFDVNDDSGAHPAPWWQYAWNEIRRSRGEAIQAGFKGNDIIEEQLLVSLNDMLPDIRLKAADGVGFSLSIPPLQGTALFNKISSIEGGFLVPEADLKVVRELNTIEQWRA